MAAARATSQRTPHGRNHEQVAGEIRQLILGGLLGPGQPVNQDEIAERLGVSRMPVREALRTLAVEGLVQFHPNRGAVVTELSRRDMEELYALRIMLEGPAARRSAENMTSEHLTGLQGLIKEMERLRDGPRAEWAEVHYRFHLSLYESAGMPRLGRLIAGLRNLVEPYSRIYIRLPERMRQAEREHRDLVAACRKRDGKRAEKVLVEHLSSPSRALLDLLP